MSDAAAASSSSSSSSSGFKPPPELASILSQVSSLQGEKERLARELEEARSKMDKLQVLLAGPRAARRLIFPLFFRRFFSGLTLTLSRRRRRESGRR